MATVKTIMRIFDYEKAVQFYIDWLGFKISWEHKEDGGPVYMEICLRDIVLHLSEHHGDSTPGTYVFIDNFDGLVDYHKIHIEKKYKYNRPEIQQPFHDGTALEVMVYDPFGNRLIFVERNARSD